MSYTSKGSPVYTQVKRGWVWVALVSLLTTFGGAAVAAPAAAAEIPNGVAGVVTDELGDAMASVQVIAYRQVFTGVWFQQNWATTDESGYYEMLLGSEQYRLEFVPSDSVHAREYWDSEYSFAEADTITVLDGAVVTADAQLAIGGSISGHVGGESATNDLAGAQVNIYRLSTFQSWSMLGATTTDEHGDYSFAGLGTGDYRVEFRAPMGENYISEFYDGAMEVTSATDVAVLVGADTSDIDAVLTSGGTISGTVMGDAEGGPIPLEGVQVRADKAAYDGTTVPSVTTAADGSYTITGADPGDYIISFTPSGGEYLQEYWDNQSLYQNANLANVTVDATLTANALLERAAQVSGVVTGPDGEPLQYARVSVTNPQGFMNNFNSSAQTDENGSFTIGALGAGDHVIRYEPPFGTSFAQEWWDDSTSLAQADIITISAGEVRGGFDAQLSVGATISGSVDGDGAGDLAGVTVEALLYDDDLLLATRTTQTDADGNYSFTGLEPGSWLVRFSAFAAGWGQQFWQGAVGRSDADPIELALGEERAGIDATLIQGATFSGTVTGDADPSPVPVTSFVSAERLGSDGSWERVAQVTANSSGAYSLSGLGTGTYRFTFNGSGGYAAEYWGDGYFEDEAEHVDLAVGQVDDGNDVLLAPSAMIRGEIHGENNTVIYGIGIRALFERSPGVWEEPPLIGGSGDADRYRFSTLPAGTYRIEFSDNQVGEHTYVTQWWSLSDTFEGATDIVLEAGDVVEDVSAVMREAADPPLSPTPTPTISGAPQAGTELRAEPGSWGPGDVVLAYQWLVGGVPRDGATNQTFTPLPSDAGATVSVEVTGSKEGYAAATVSSTPTAPLLPVFSDVAANHAFGTEITWMFSSGISRGYLDSSGVRSYHTEEAVSRQAMAAFLYRLAGSPDFTPPATATFSDVPTSHFFFKEIEWMKAQGITTGNADGTYTPDAAVSRQAMAAFLYRYEGRPTYVPPVAPSFPDVATGHTFFKEIEWMRSEGITNGYPDGYHPDEDVSRQAMAAFLYRTTH